MQRYDFTGMVEEVPVVLMYAAVDATPLKVKADFEAMFRRAGIPDAELTQQNIFGYNNGFDTGSTLARIAGIEVSTMDHKFNFRKRFPTERGYMVTSGMYAGVNAPGIVMLAPSGMNCGLEEANAAVDDFISKSGLKEAQFPEKIIEGIRSLERVKLGITLEKTLKELRRYKRFEM